MSLRTSAVTAALAAVVLLQAPVISAAEDVKPNPGIEGVSGLSWDAQNQQLFVLKEKPQANAVTILDVAGTAQGEVGFIADIVSPQALALSGDKLYIADIGDPNLNRDHVTIYGVAAAAGQQRYNAWDFRYPEGAQDAKAFAVSGKGRFYLITAGDNPGIYNANLEPSRSGVNTLSRATDAPSGVTDAVFLSDGKTLMLRTADGVQLIDAYTWQVTDQVKYVDGPPGESLTVFEDGRILVGAGPFRDEPLPNGNTTATPVPSAKESSSSPKPEPTASESSPAPSASPSASPEKTGNGGFAGLGRGTLIALAGAALLSLAATVTVFIFKN